MKKPTLKELVKKFQDDDYIEIGYITGIQRFYKRESKGLCNV